ncbi:chain-length determining protein [Salinicola salarius]|uniref:chain-length determining protein n=1 Tax=Salinicola salarius TaxID=430457 RepID=UPI000DA16AFC|nr:chain-length determining protein [Salinicola salarius]
MRVQSYLKKHPHWAICFLAIIVNAFYWGIWASDRYVSHANVVLESPQLSQPQLNFSSLLTGGGGNADMLVLRDYMRSVDMLKYLIDNADYSEHYANSGADIFSRLSSADEPLEKIYDYYLDHVSIEVDDYAGVLRVDAEAFTPEKAHQVASLLLEEGERHMNELGRQLAEEQVSFLEGQVELLKQRYEDTRQQMLEYQNENGLVSPTGTVESLSSVVSSLQGELASLQAQKSALMSFQSSQSPQIVRINSQIRALNEQITQEQQRLATKSGDSLNAVSSEYQRLQLQAQFAQESYSGALSALENTRIEAARKLKQLSVLQSPTMPEYPERPERLYDIVLFTVIALFITLIVNMLILIVRDHRD